MSTLDELVSKIKGYLKGMPLERVKLLTHEDFSRELGVDLKRLKPEWKDEVTRTLYKHGMSYRQIASILGRSMRDISRAVRGGCGGAWRRAPEGLTSVDVEVAKKAIQLMREGKVRNANDLVLELGLNLEQAKCLYDAIVDNERVITVSTVEAAQRIERSWKSVVKYSRRLEEEVESLKREVEECEKRAKDVVEGLKRDIEGEVKFVERFRGEAVKDLLKLQEVFTSLDIHVKTLMDFMSRVQELRERVERLEDGFKRLEECTSKIKEAEAGLKRMGMEISRLKGELNEMAVLKSLAYWLEVCLKPLTSSHYHYCRCAYEDEYGYCTVGWSAPLQGLEVKEVVEGGRKVYCVNVKDHRWICVTCPLYRPAWLNDFLKQVEKSSGSLKSGAELQYFDK